MLAQFSAMVLSLTFELRFCASLQRVVMEFAARYGVHFHFFFPSPHSFFVKSSHRVLLPHSPTTRHLTLDMTALFACVLHISVTIASLGGVVCSVPRAPIHSRTRSAHHLLDINVLR